MKKITYVMHVDWNWIKQRPQYIAEALAQAHDITVLYPHRYRRTGYQRRDAGDIRLKPIYLIPKGSRYPVLRTLNQRLRDAIIARHVTKTRADCLYLPFPDYIGAIPKGYTGKVIYDCMDNHPAFIEDAAMRAVLEQQEIALVHRADTVLVSSEKLRQLLIARCGPACADKIVLVRNGYNGQMLDVSETAPQPSDPYTLAYFGTISSWFNFKYVLQSLEDFPQLHYRLIGPVEGVKLPEHPRLSYIGTVEHKALPEATADAQCLIMPFLRNEIIESVDPVKLYEYINFNKNILCVQYPEVERFAPFVHFYTDYETYKNQLRVLMDRSDVKYTLEQRQSFLLENSWESRVRIIDGLI